ncbi:hypothetical protein AMAG_04901 [Allomyces macrogynus ATCC 38327]|uniref:BHLH domain-containing protein n=1 Tax=Allomyces macrogynus (strain ATCC 38327) TaxID=578462 RepID=A0A0L0S6S1_ALLM3|nr:hypothetical protein AMAG_04901 [Allomyces macrogynus ATCC 38327]|eukprot:KNE58081.1 hypothetical protein AMAG_04901 [Allomyces macrogynus ATCC 38327]
MQAYAPASAAPPLPTALPADDARFLDAFLAYDSSATPSSVDLHAGGGSNAHETGHHQYASRAPSQLASQYPPPASAWSVPNAPDLDALLHPATTAGMRPGGGYYAYGSGAQMQQHPQMQQQYANHATHAHDQQQQQNAFPQPASTAAPPSDADGTGAGKADVLSMLAQTLASNQQAQQLLIKKLEEQSAQTMLLEQKLAEVERRATGVPSPHPPTPAATQMHHPAGVGLGMSMGQQQQGTTFTLTHPSPYVTAVAPMDVDMTPTMAPAASAGYDHASHAHHHHHVSSAPQAPTPQFGGMSAASFHASVVTTPTMSPAVTYTPSLAFSRMSMHGSYAHDHAAFSPLTSPALRGARGGNLGDLAPLPPSHLARSETMDAGMTGVPLDAGMGVGAAALPSPFMQPPMQQTQQQTQQQQAAAMLPVTPAALMRSMQQGGSAGAMAVPAHLGGSDHGSNVSSSAASPNLNHPSTSPAHATRSLPTTVFAAPTTAPSTTIPSSSTTSSSSLHSRRAAVAGGKVSKVTKLATATPYPRSSPRLAPMAAAAAIAAAAKSPVLLTRGNSHPSPALPPNSWVPPTPTSAPAPLPLPSPAIDATGTRHLPTIAPHPGPSGTAAPSSSGGSVAPALVNMAALGGYASLGLAQGMLLDGLVTSPGMHPNNPTAAGSSNTGGGGTGSGVPIEKRAVHKDAEQKRRSAMKNGFDELRLIIPGLQFSVTTRRSKYNPHVPTAAERRRRSKQEKAMGKSISKLMVLKTAHDYILFLKARERRLMGVMHAFLQQHGGSGTAPEVEIAKDLEQNADDVFFTYVKETLWKSAAAAAAAEAAVPPGATGAVAKAGRGRRAAGNKDAAAAASVTAAGVSGPGGVGTAEAMQDVHQAHTAVHDHDDDEDGGEMDEDSDSD